jgi:hypothetical protein
LIPKATIIAKISKSAKSYLRPRPCTLAKSGETIRNRKCLAKTKHSKESSAAVERMTSKNGSESAGNAPNSDSTISAFGMIRIPTARLAVNRSPTIASGGIRLLPSNQKIRKAAAVRKTITP